MATKLKNLKITKVDFVDEGANPDADIGITKNRGDAGGVHEAQEITPEQQGIFKRMMDWFKKTIETPEAGEPEEIAKGDVKTFNQQYIRRNRDKVAQDIWDMCYALSDALMSAVYADDIDDAARNEAMQGSILEFESIIGTAAESWAKGMPAGIECVKADEAVSDGVAKAMEATRDRLSDAIAKAARGPEKQEPTNIQSKGDEEMKIDKSKMTPAEKAMLEEFEKRYGMSDEAGQENAAAPAGGVAKSVQTQAAEADDIYKGMSPAAKAELEALKKFREATEDRELHEIAKSYEIIGKKDEELFPILKSLKAVSEEAYNNMISTLDSTKTAIEKSGVFSEIGKCGNGSVKHGGVVKEVEAKAAELMKAKASLTKEQAIDAVLMADADLAKRYETEED